MKTQHHLLIVLMLFALNIQKASSQDTAWIYNGNVVTNPNTWIGTITNQPFIMKTSSQPRVIIDASGKVGIGTQTPRNLSHLHGGLSAVYSQFTNTATTDTNTTSGFRIGIDANGNAILRNKYSSSTNGTMNFYTADLERMRISNAGNVGIGTILPRERLEVNGNILVSGRILVANDGNTYDLLVLILQLQNEVAQLKQQLMIMTKN